MIPFILGFTLLGFVSGQQGQQFPAGQQFQPGQQFPSGQQFQAGQTQPGQQFQPGQVQPGQQFQNGQVQPGQQFQNGQVQPGQQFQNGQVQPGQQFQPGQVQSGQQFQPGQAQPGQQFQPGQILPGQQFQPGQIQPGQQAQPGQQTGQIQPGQQLPGQPAQPGQVQPGQVADPSGQTATNAPNTAPQPGQCIQQVQQISVNCFMKQGVPIQLADAIITNGTMVQLPPNANVAELRNALCAIRTDLIQCIIPPTLTMRGEGACIDKKEFNFAEGQIVNRINALQSVCGAGNLSPASECIKTLKPDMQECHNKVGFDKSMFVSNSSAVKGALIGRDKPSAVKFCASRLELYQCMRGVIDACPGAREYMLLTGYDHDSMEKSIEVLCQDIDVYVSGLSCFQEPPPSVIACFDDMMAKMIELTAREIENVVDKEKYFKEYCRVRVEHLQCDMKGWKDKCPADSVGLKNEHECTLLPARCQKDASLNQQLENVCKTSNFERKLRQLQTNKQDNAAGTAYSSFVGTAIGLFFAVILSAL